MLPHSEACERNKEPILGVLSEALRNVTTVLEIGSGTGQHAVHFATHLRHLVWQPTDRREYLPGLSARVRLEGPINLYAPLELDVCSETWPATSFDAVFTANTLHIMSWPEVEALLRGAAASLAPGGRLLVYGPFRYGGRYTSHSNALFDEQLRARDPASGIRDFEAVDELAAAVGMAAEADHAMPANNRLVIWRLPADGQRGRGTMGATTA
jgi:SAM-dependent methyltransferase